MRFDWLVGARLALAASVHGPLALGEPAPDAAQLPAADRNTPKAAPSSPISIPFELRDNLVVIETLINGRKHHAVLDSGAAAMIVDRVFAENIDVDEGQPAGDAAGAGEQAQQLRPVDLSSLIVGPLQFEHLPGYSIDLEQLSSSAGFPIRLLIGSPAFKFAAVTVDYKRRRVTFGPSGSQRRCDAPIPLTLVHDVPVVDVELRTTTQSEAVRLKLVVDLGTRHRAMILGGPFVRSEGGKALMQSGKPQQVGHGIGGQVDGSVARVAELRAGDSRTTHVEVALSSEMPAFEAGGIDGSLGVPFWANGVITFDYPARSLCIER
jgi:hypothetical protein